MLVSGVSPVADVSGVTVVRSVVVTGVLSEDTVGEGRVTLVLVTPAVVAGLGSVGTAVVPDTVVSTESVVLSEVVVVVVAIVVVVTSPVSLASVSVTVVMVLIDVTTVVASELGGSQGVVVTVLAVGGDTVVSSVVVSSVVVSTEDVGVAVVVVSVTVGLFAVLGLEESVLVGVN